MKNKGILAVLFSILVHSVYAARPTVQSSNFKYNNLNCDAVTLNWTNGDGGARVIFIRKGGSVNYDPVDGTEYTSNPAFGGTGSGPFGPTNDVWCVYNANGTNFVKVTGLQPGQVYYFKIYEHDNQGNQTKYLTPGDSQNITTYNIILNFDIENLDSCQMTNNFKFTNTSTSSISGLTYTWDFGDGTATTSPVTHHFTGNGGYKDIRIIPVTLLSGCPTYFKKSVKIFPKKIGYIDKATYKDSQCLEDNYYEIGSISPLMPFPMGVTYHWWFGDNTESTFPKMRKKYKQSGTFQVMLELNSMSYSQPTACKDTIFFNLTVLPSPVGNMSINDTVQCLKNNRFDFKNPDNTLTYFKWYFGDKDSSGLQSVSHVYKDTGTYRVMHVAYANSGCKGRDTVEVKVLPNLNSAFNGLDSFYCSSNTPINIQATDTTGAFKDYSVKNFKLVPNKIGLNKLTYIVKDQYCSDTTYKLFNVYKTPSPSVGRDTAICNITSFDISANTNGKYLWSNGDTTKSITVYASGLYVVKVTEGKCSASDSIRVVFATVPKVNLPGDTMLCKGGGLWLNAAFPKSTYMWNTGSKDSMIYAFQPGKYIVTVTNPCGEATDSNYLYFQGENCDLFMANAFSPGNDLVNNVFMPRGRNITVTSFQIYNRWGELIFETDQDGVGWDGKFEGEYVQEGLYLWILRYNTPNGPYIKKANASGQILLLR